MYMADELIQDGQPRSHTLDWENRLQTNLAQEYLTFDAEVLSLTAEADLGWASLTSVTSQLDVFTIFEQDRTFLISAWGLADWDPCASSPMAGATTVRSPRRFAWSRLPTPSGVSTGLPALLCGPDGLGGVQGLFRG